MLSMKARELAAFGFALGLGIALPIVGFAVWADLPAGRIWETLTQPRGSNGPHQRLGDLLGGAVPIDATAWAPLIRQNAGGTSQGHHFVWADQNVEFSGDHVEIQAPNPLIFHSNVAGTPIVGEQPGFSVALSTGTYSVTYTVQSGDTNTFLAMALQRCIGDNLGNPPGPHCNYTGPAQLSAAMVAFGFRPAAGNGELGNGIDLDMPPVPILRSITGISSAHTTISVLPNNIGDATTDNGPFFGVTCYNPGRPPKAGDHCGMYRFDGQSSTSNVDTQYGNIFMNIVDPTAGSQLGELCFAAEDAAHNAGNPAATPTFCISRGMYGTDGRGNKLSDLGAGTFNQTAINAETQLTAGGTTGSRFQAKSAAPAAGATAISLSVGNNGGPNLVPVTIGPTDGCGPGFRCLRVPN
jgi:hypothetical protein